MAVEDKYVDSKLESGFHTAAMFEHGCSTFTAVATVSVAAADDDGSVYRLFANMPSNAVPVSICIHNTAVTGGTDYDLGLYKAGGVVVDKDILADGLDMSTARTVATVNNAGMTTIAIADGVKTFAELSAQDDPDASYDIVLTANTVGTAAGTIRVTGTFATL